MVSAIWPEAWCPAIAGFGGSKQLKLVNLVFERPDINKLKAEGELSGEALDLVGVDTMILGSLTEFGHSSTGKKGFMGSTKKQTAETSVELRLVDVKTGHVFFPAAGMPLPRRGQG